MSESSVSPPSAERESSYDDSVVHHEPHPQAQDMSCGTDRADLGLDTYSADPAAVDCRPCLDVLAHGESPLASALTTDDVEDMLRESAARLDPAPEPVLPRDVDEFNDHYVPERDLTAPHPYVNSIHSDLDGYCGICGMGETELRHAPAEHRTVGLEVLTDELRQLYDIWGTRGTLVGIVCRVDDEAIDVPEVQSLWEASYRKPADVLARMLVQARHYADGGIEGNGGAELLMPGPDVLAALEGKPVGRYTGPVPSSWGVVERGWLAMVDVDLGDRRDVHWLTVEGRRGCDRDDCIVGEYCEVITLTGRGVQHLPSYHPVSVRIPANEERTR
jgi:hypothetical protein